MKFRFIFYTLIISLNVIISSCGQTEETKEKEKTKCTGLHCDFLSVISNEFEKTGGDKDQGYIFLRDHSEQDSTTNRVIIRSIEGIFYAYPSNDGWYAQSKGGQQKISLNELGHSLAEKENEFEEKLNSMFNNRLNQYIVTMKRNASYNNERLKNIGISIIDTSIFNSLSIDTSFLSKELMLLRRGELSFNDFLSVFNNSNDLFEGRTFKKNIKPQVGFYSDKLDFFPISNYYGYIFYSEIEEKKQEEISYEERTEYLINSKKVVTGLVEKSTYNNRLAFRYECNPLIYSPNQKKWYGPDKFKEVFSKINVIKK